MLGILGVVAVPTSMIGISQSLAGGDGKGNKQDSKGASGGGEAGSKDDPKLAKFNAYTRCTATKSSKKDQVDGKVVVLKDGRMYLDDPQNRKYPSAHPFSGFFLEFPDPSIPGLVSTISADPPVLNWVFIDPRTHEVRYGSKSQCEAANGKLGPWDWTSDQKSVVFDGWEGFIALEESSGVWVLCFDVDDDHLKATGLRNNRRVLELSLERKLIPP